MKLPVVVLFAGAIAAAGRRRVRRSERSVAVSAVLPSPCFNESQLRGLLAGASLDEAADGAAQHLEHCESCRRRLEALAGAPEVLRGVSGLKGGGDSPILRELVQQLRRETPGGDEGMMSEGSAEDDATILAPPEKPGCLGRFAGCDVTERIAAGGMGVVYRAHDASLDRFVAIKILAPHWAASRNARARFLREARAAAAVVHESVVAIHAVGEDRGLPYLIMPLVKGQTLQKRLAQGPFSVAEILRIGGQIAAGLGAAHAQGLVHRDVKPGNILLEAPMERVMLTDFGLARAVDQPGVTQLGTVAGTPEYMAPEQARGERVDARSDLFGLGCVLYAMTVGRSPFAADSIPAALRKVCEERPPAVTTLNPAIPVALAHLIDRLLEKHPDDRYQSADEVGRALALCRADSGVAHAAVSFASRPTAWRRRRVRLTWAVAALVIAGLVGLIVFRGQRSKPVGAIAVNEAYLLHHPGTEKPRAFSRLDEAMGAMVSGDVVEIRVDGVIECDPMRLGAKAVGLRAGPGFHPILVNRSAVVPLISAEAPLVLEGLELRAAKADADVVHHTGQGALARMNLRTVLHPNGLGSVVYVRRAPLFLSHCRLVGVNRPQQGELPVLVLEDSPWAEANHSDFYCSGGPVVRWRFEDKSDGTNGVPGRLSLRNCTALCVDFIQVESLAKVERHLDLFNNSVFGVHLLDGYGSSVVVVQANTNVFDVQRVFSQRVRVAGDSQQYRWSGHRNLYRDPTKTRVRIPNAFEDRSKLLAWMNASETQSLMVALKIGARIMERASLTNLVRPKDFQLWGTWSAAGTEDVPNSDARTWGAVIEQVGPGGPYAHWVGTGAAREWQAARPQNLQSKTNK